MKNVAPYYDCMVPYMFHVEHNYSVLVTYGPSAVWKQKQLLQEAHLKGGGGKEKKKFQPGI
jgi:hypothetical protein